MSPVENRMEDYELVARATHEAVRSYSAHFGYIVPPMWAELSGEVKATLMNSCINSINGLPKEDFHNNWVKMKIEQGWSYGKEFSLDNKVHPALMPYKQISEDLRRKNNMFWEVSRSVARAIGMPVVEVITGW